jgi:Na+/H+ antiporter NhaC
MEFLTVVIMAITMFGGYAIDSVVSVMTATKLGGAASGGYELIQYIPNVFYGILFLILVGVCVQFILECVQVSDHTNSFTQSN